MRPIVMHMIRLLLPLVMFAISACSGVVPAIFRMPEFGAQFRPATLGQPTPDSAILIIYRDSSIEERIKYGVGVARIEPRRGTLASGYVFDGSFLRVVGPSGTWRVSRGSLWWDENPPVGESFFGRMNHGHPPAEDGSVTVSGEPTARSGFAVLELALEPGTVTFLKITRSISSQLVECGLARDAVTICRRNVVTTALEAVSPGTARTELVGLREVVYDGAQG